MNLLSFGSKKATGNADALEKEGLYSRFFYTCAVTKRVFSEDPRRARITKSVASDVGFFSIFVNILKKKIDFGVGVVSHCTLRSNKQ